jgi:hypothetical protein
MEHGWQAKKVVLPGPGAPKTQDLVIPNPKLKLMDQVREVLRVKHYTIQINEPSQSSEQASARQLA